MIKVLIKKIFHLLCIVIPLQSYDLPVCLDNFSIVGREDNSIARNIKEAIFIRVNDPSFNRNIGKFQLPHIWDEVLARSPELQLK